MTEPNKNNTVDNVELENNVSLVDEQDTSHNKLDCDEIHKMLTECKNSNIGNEENCIDLLEKFKNCSNNSKIGNNSYKVRYGSK